MKSFRPWSTRIACSPRGLSPAWSMYFGYRSRFGLSGPAGRPRPVVGVLDPPARRVHDVRAVLDAVDSVPLGRGVAAVNRPRPVEPVVPPGHELRVEVGDVPVGVGVDRVVRRVGVQLHHLPVLGQRASPGAEERLAQRLHRLLHQPDADPLPARRAHDRPVVRPVDREDLGRHAAGGAVGNADRPRHERPLLAAVAIEQPAAPPDDGLRVLIHRVGAGRGVHPAQPVVEALVDEELAPRRRAVGVEPLPARHLQLGAEEERGVRVDEEQGAVVHGVRRRDGEAVRAGGLARPGARLRRSGAARAVSVERLERVQRHALDVAADAALAEAERHPRLEPRDHPRLHGRVGVQVVVEPVGPRVHQALEPRGAGRVLRPHAVRIDEQLHPQVLPDGALPFGLGEPTRRVQVVGLDPVEVVLRLGVDHPEDRVGVGAGRGRGRCPSRRGRW